MRTATAAIHSNRAARLVSRFRSPVDQVAVSRVSSTYLRLSEAIGSGVFWQIDYRSDVATAVPGGYTVPRMPEKSRCGYPMLPVDDTESMVAFLGTWTTITQAAALGGSYRSNGTTGNSVVWTAPTSTDLAAVFATSPSQGLVTVAIDSDLTAATLLPTAADWCTANGVTNGVLTTHASPGTLLPTTRVLDCYSLITTYAVSQVLARGLTSASHSVEIAVTGYKNPAASDVRFGCDGFLYAGASTAIDTTRSVLQYAAGVYVDQTDASFTYTGAGWGSIVPAPSSATFGGDYKRTTATGNSLTMVVPAGPGRVAIEALNQSDSGLIKVDLTGGVANLLLTAKQWCALNGVTNGVLTTHSTPGTLAPTDRVLDQYRSVASHVVDAMLADGLDAGTSHTFTFTNTVYKNPASTGNRFAITARIGYAYTTSLTSGMMLVQDQAVLTVRSSAWPLAVSCTPAAATGSTGPTQTFTAQVHGYEKALTETVVMDGATLTLTDGQTVTGTRLVITQTTELHHPDWQTVSGDPKIADVTYVYTLTRDGFTTDVTVTWAATVTKFADYAGMFPLDSAWSVVGWDTRAPLTLTAHDGAFYGKAASTLIWSRTAGMYAALMWAPDPDTFGQRAYSDPNYNFVEDGTPATGTNKLYLSRVSANRTAPQAQTVTSGTVEHRRVTRQVARFTAGAASVLNA